MSVEVNKSHFFDMPPPVFAQRSRDPYLKPYLPLSQLIQLRFFDNEFGNIESRVFGDGTLSSVIDCEGPDSRLLMVSAF